MIKTSWIAALLVATCLIVQSVRGQEADLNLWFPAQFIHPVGEKLDISFQSEIRLQDDISEYDELVLKPAANFHFNDKWALSLGYKYINKFERANENDIWQEVHYNTKYKDLISGSQLRMEERFIDDVDGIVPRLRLLQHLSHPIGETPNYLTGFLAMRFNLDNKKEGPIQGFEQSRIYVAWGRHFGNHIQFETGYLWRYEFQRDEFDSNDHAIHFQFLYNTRKKEVKKPTHRDRYR